MPHDYMSDEMEQTPEAKPAPENDRKSETKTALLPIPFFQGKELAPGTVCSVKIESVQSDQVEVSYVPHSEEEYEEGEGGDEDANYGVPPPPDLMG